MENTYITTVEGLRVLISYRYEEGTKGDRDTPPSGGDVEIIGWKLARGDTREHHQDIDNEEWEEWMELIDEYVWNDSPRTILEFEEDFSSDVW